MRGEASSEWKKKSEEDKLREYAREAQKYAADELTGKKPSANYQMAAEAQDELDSYPFWCEKCREDFDAPCCKEWHRLYGDSIAVYRAIHECGQEAIRHITHRDHDPYYYLSERVLEDRMRYATDVLQPDDYGFRLNYGEPYKEYDDRLMKREEKRIKKERDKGFKLSR